MTSWWTKKWSSLVYCFSMCIVGMGLVECIELSREANLSMPPLEKTQWQDLCCVVDAISARNLKSIKRPFDHWRLGAARKDFTHACTNEQANAWEQRSTGDNATEEDCPLKNALLSCWSYYDEPPRVNVIITSAGEEKLCQSNADSSRTTCLNVG